MKEEIASLHHELDQALLNLQLSQQEAASADPNTPEYRDRLSEIKVALEGYTWIIKAIEDQLVARK